MCSGFELPSRAPPVLDSLLDCSGGAVCVCVCVCVYVYALFLPVITSGGCCSEREEVGDKVVDGWGGREAKEGDGGASDR